MIKITIPGIRRRFKGVYRWEDITLARFCNLAAIPIPEAYEAFVTADAKYETVDQFIADVSKITAEQRAGFPAYYRKVVLCLTNIPKRILDRVGDDEIRDLYYSYFRPFVLSLIYHAPVISFLGEIQSYTPPSIKRIRVGWQLFRLPQSINLQGDIIPLAKEPVMSYLEASDVFKDMRVSRDDVRRLALFMAIYCRKWYDKYSDDLVLRRQTLFMKAPMSAVWSVFFYTVRRLPGSIRAIRLFGGLQKTAEETIQAAQTFRSMAAAG